MLCNSTIRFQRIARITGIIIHSAKLLDLQFKESRTINREFYSVLSPKSCYGNHPVCGGRPVLRAFTKLPSYQVIQNHIDWYNQEFISINSCNLGFILTTATTSTTSKSSAPFPLLFIRPLQALSSLNLQLVCL